MGRFSGRIRPLQESRIVEKASYIIRFCTDKNVAQPHAADPASDTIAQSKTSAKRTLFIRNAGEV